MPAPMLYAHRHEPGIVGMLSRMWLSHRRRVVRKALANVRR